MEGGAEGARPSPAPRLARPGPALGAPPRALCWRWRQGPRAMSSPKNGFYQQEITKTLWEVRDRYRDLQPVGSGAYGTVW